MGGEHATPTLDHMLPKLTSQDQVEAFIAMTGPVWLFKHSSSCGVSAAALEQVESYSVAHPNEGVGMVVIQDSRPLSSWIGNKLHYVHQSPQLFLLRDGRVVWSASHWAISADAMAKASTLP